MGLDQYLEARKYISQNNWVDGNSIPTPDFAALAAFAPEGLSKYADFGGATISYPVGYWRKANAIHGWFVENVQNGEDNCQSYYVTREQLANLAEACEEVLKVSVGVSMEDAAATAGLLPTQGFFFGSYEIDEYYMEDLKTTIQIIDHALSVVPKDDYTWSFYYSSSW